MEENIRKKVLEIIRDSINETVYEQMKNLPEVLKTKQEELKKTKAQRDIDAHEALFGREDNKFQYRLNLREGVEKIKPRITSAELSDFESNAKKQFPEISFDKQRTNGQIVSFPLASGKVDAVASGKITAKGGQSINFTMSLLNGFNVKSSNDMNSKGFEINNETKDMFSKMLNFYDTVFKEKFNGIINPSDESGEPPTQEPGIAPAPPLGMEPPAPVPPANLAAPSGV